MLMSNYKPSLINLFSRVQAVRSRPLECRKDCLVIQEDLLRRVIYVEKRIKSLRLQIKELRRLQAGKGSVRVSGTESRSVKADIERKRQLIEQYKGILYILKSIGDALAFIYISKWDIKPMTFKENAGHVHGKEGLKHELALLRQVYEVEDTLAIMNDLTNSLRYGDLTIVGEEFFIPVEVKSSGRPNQRRKRQEAKLEKMMSYLSEDRTVGLYELPAEFVRSSLLVGEKDHVDVLNKVIGEAYRDGFAFSKVEEGLYYWVVVEGHPDGWHEESDHPGGFNLLLDEFEGKEPYFFFVNQSKFDTLGRYPYTLSIRDPQALFDFYSEQLNLNVIVDIAVMSAKFACHNLEVTLVEDENVMLIIKNTDSDMAEERFDTMAVSRHLFERVAYEFLSLDWFVEEIARRMDVSACTEHELSSLSAVQADRSEEDRTRSALEHARQLALRRGEKPSREG